VTSFIHENVIERKALELLASYSKNHSWEFSFPIPIDLIIDTELGYGNAVANLGDPLILGAISPLEQLIYTNEKSEERFQKYPGLYRFTLGHEVGHWALHLSGIDGQMKISEDFPYPFICRDTNNKPSIEIQADMFSAAILMPTDLVKETVSGRDIFSWPALYQLRDEWGVSISALKIRLEKLGLIYHCPETDRFFRSEAHANGQQSLFA
jgi:Zn-dependent peptidase ImmA (M78 family)